MTEVQQQVLIVKRNHGHSGPHGIPEEPGKGKLRREFTEWMDPIVSNTCNYCNPARFGYHSKKFQYFFISNGGSVQYGTFTGNTTYPQRSNSKRR